MPLYGHA
jgi:hypothetical protein